MEKKLVTKIFIELQKQISKPATELLYSNPFELLIAVILSAQATDVSVNKVTRALFKCAPTPEHMLALGEKRLKCYIKTIGLYNTKAKNIIRTSEILVAKYHSNIPSTREDLESLPGVGRKTANVVLNEAFGKPTIAVDTHVMRVSRRIGLAHGHSPLKIEQQLERVIPQRFKTTAHSLLILHGRYICVARKPRCEKCVIISMCDYASLL